jgi:hypothetical protein
MWPNNILQLGINKAIVKRIPKVWGTHDLKTLPFVVPFDCFQNVHKIHKPFKIFTIGHFNSSLTPVMLWMFPSSFFFSNYKATCVWKA